MINPRARKAMFEKFNQKFLPRLAPPVPPMPMPEASAMPVTPSPMAPVRNPRRMRYAFGGEVMPPQPDARQIPDPRMPPNAIVPGIGTSSGLGRPNPLAGWVSPYGPPQPQSGMGTEPGITGWPSMGTMNKPGPEQSPGGFGKGNIQTFRQGGMVEVHGGDMFDPGPWSEPGALHEPDALHQDFMGDIRNLSTWDTYNNFGYQPNQGWSNNGPTMDQTNWVNYPGVGYVPMAIPAMPSFFTGQGAANANAPMMHEVNQGEKVPRPKVPLRGYGKDTVPAVLTPGEIVIPRPGDTSNARRKYLMRLAASEGKKKVKKYNDGGKVGDPERINDTDSRSEEELRAAGHKIYTPNSQDDIDALPPSAYFKYQGEVYKKIPDRGGLLLNKGGEVESYPDAPNGPSHSYPVGAETKAGLFDVGEPTPDQEGDHDQDESDTGLVTLPSMDTGRVMGSGIYEMDGKYYILPTQVEDEEQLGPTQRYKATQEHLGVFKTLEDAKKFEEKYFSNLGEE